jgi:glycosyltransferase involved in cell wall biosynthesis
VAFPPLEKKWLIFSYRANISGSACSQHIDDRLPHLVKRNITPVLLSGMIGDRSTEWLHYRCCSIAPSGIRFELRHFLRKKFKKRWLFKTVETLLLLPVLPFYLLEKIILNLESEWSWFFVASFRGYFLCRKYRPTVIYSTGGTASAHVAAGIVSRLTGLPWLAETQDPLVHDHDWTRGERVLNVYKWLERKICRQADSFIFLTQAARENMADRTGMKACGKVIYPGADPGLFNESRYQKGDVCHFAHFGTLAGSRNLVVFLRALDSLIQEKKIHREQVQIDIYGSLDGASRKVMDETDLHDLLTDHGVVNRKKAVLEMQKADCLLLIQNTIFFSSETIPSKVYEYMLSGRPIFGLIYHNLELESMIREGGYFLAQADDVEAVASEVMRILHSFSETSFASWSKNDKRIVTMAVDQLISLADKMQLA